MKIKKDDLIKKIDKEDCFNLLDETGILAIVSKHDRALYVV